MLGSASIRPATPEVDLKSKAEFSSLSPPLFLCRQEPGISSLLLGVVFLDEETSGSLELLGRVFLVDKKLAD